MALLAIPLALLVGLVASLVPRLAMRGPPWAAGLVAAAPVTPTAAAAVVAGGVDWLAGLHLVAGVTAGLAVAAWGENRPWMFPLGVLVAAAATGVLLSLRSMATSMAFLGIVLVVGAAAPVAPVGVPGGKCVRKAIVHGILISAVVVALPLLSRFGPTMAGIVAALPLLLLASLANARLTGGPSAARRVVQGAFGPSAGIAAFLGFLSVAQGRVGVALALAGAWACYVAVAVLWSFLVRPRRLRRFHS